MKHENLKKIIDVADEGLNAIDGLLSVLEDTVIDGEEIVKKIDNAKIVKAYLEQTRAEVFADYLEAVSSLLKESSGFICGFLGVAVERFNYDNVDYTGWSDEQMVCYYLRHYYLNRDKELEQLP